MGKPIAVDLFSGAGGLSEGLRQAGFRVAGALELDSDAADVYSINHSTTVLIQDDICNVDPNEAAAAFGIKGKSLDLLAGCPPCQGFSTIGTRNRKASSEDPRNDLIFQMLRFVKSWRPKIIMIENVPALANDYRMTSFKKNLIDLGYCVDVSVLNVQQYKVPQRRRRMILLASRIGKIQVKNVDLTNGRPSTVKDAFAIIDDNFVKRDALSSMGEKRSPHVKAMIKAIPHDGGSRTDLPEKYVLTCHRKTDGFRDVYGRMAWNSPSPTITCGCTNPSKGRFLHPEEDRAITLREAAVLQSFPLGYSFPAEKGKQKLSRMIGNALPPKFIRFHALCAKAVIRHAD